jgi:hypothetical protein
MPPGDEHVLRGREHEQVLQEGQTFWIRAKSLADF